MYCSSCGKDINPDLSFCNYCGARIGGSAEADPNTLSESSFNLIAGALLTIPIVGIGLILGLLVVMKRELGLSDELIQSVVVLSFVLLVTSEAGFIWLMLTRTRKRKKQNGKDKKPSLDDADPRYLAEAKQDSIPTEVYSVTDHTTRTLDKVPRVPKDE